MRTHHSRAWRSRPILCGLVVGGALVGGCGRWEDGAGRTGKLVLVLEEFVAELVGADQHTGLGVACVLPSAAVPWSTRTARGLSSIVPMYCRREAAGLAGAWWVVGADEGGAHVELVPEVLQRSHCQCLVVLSWVVAGAHLQANPAQVAQSPCNGRHGCWGWVN